MSEQDRASTEADDGDDDEDSSPICRILEEQLWNPAVLMHVYGDKARNLYVMLDDVDDDAQDEGDDAEADQRLLQSNNSVWRPALYALLAYHGFMIIAYGEKMLLPEMQKTQCIIDWEHLHVSKKTKRLARTGRYSLSISRAFANVVQGIQTSHGDKCWLGRRYAAVISELQKQVTAVPPSPDGSGQAQATIVYHSVELWSDEDELLCGEVGYTIGKVYTSMTGFVSAAVREAGSKHSGAGILQLVALGKLLQQHGYAFWNLGHPFNEAKSTMLYKRDIGGVVLERSEYLRKWFAARGQATAHPAGVGSVAADKLPCASLLSPPRDAQAAAPISSS